MAKSPVASWSDGYSVHVELGGGAPGVKDDLVVGAAIGIEKDSGVAAGGGEPAGAAAGAEKLRGYGAADDV